MRKYSNEQTSLIALRSLTHDFFRHREKRALVGVEHEYFQQYFREKGLENEYMDARRQGPRGRMINDWSNLGVRSYTDAIRQSTNYYSTQAGQGENQSPH